MKITLNKLIAVTCFAFKIFLIFTTLLFASLLVYPLGYFILDSHHDFKYHSKSDLPFSGIGAYIINLDRSVERYDYVKQHVYQLGYPVERISAIDGNMLTEEDISLKVDLIRFQRHCKYHNVGTIGCSLSHIKTWEAFLQSSYEYALIFEDDVSFDPIQLRAVIEQLIKLKKYWDINTFEIRNNFYLPVKTLKNDQKLVVYLTRVLHSGAYIINRKAADKLLRKALPIILPIDHYFNRAWEFDLKFTGIEQPRLVQQTHGTSDINRSKHHPEPNDALKDNMIRLMSRTQDTMIRFFYNLKLYFEFFNQIENQDGVEAI